MDKSKRAEKEEFWRLITEEQQASGLSARAFCAREGVSESLFYNWRSKIAARDHRMTDVDTRPQLIPVAIADSARAPSLSDDGERQFTSQRVEIQTPGGFMLRVSDEIASNCLGRLLQVVAQVDRGQRLELGAERC